MRRTETAAAQLTQRSMEHVRRQALWLLSLSPSRRSIALSQLDDLQRQSAGAVGMDMRDFELWSKATRTAIEMIVAQAERSGGAAGGSA